jgi:hypothetical protein
VHARFARKRFGHFYKQWGERESGVKKGLKSKKRKRGETKDRNREHYDGRACLCTTKMAKAALQNG